MRKLKVYLDTSVISYLHQDDAPDKMRDTLSLWETFRQDRYEVYLSDIVLDEISSCKPEISDNFTVEDIRKIREYNSLRHVKMSPQEIIADTKKGAEKVLQLLGERKETRTY